jgi:ABC-type transporter Mla subunit MlaD
MIRRVLPVIALLAACALALMFTGASDDKSADGRTYVIELDSAFGLVEGGELKVGGVRAGDIDSFKLDEENDPIKALVTVKISKPGFERLTTEASCDVRQQSLIGEYFIDCQPGDAPDDIPEGGRVPLENNSSTIPVDLVNNIMRLPYRERFRLFISELGVGLAGRPDELNEVIRRAHPGLRETSQVFEILAEQNHVLRDYIEDADRISAAVEPRRRDLSRWAKEASETATVQASRRDSIARQWNRLPVFLGELEPTAAQLEKTAGRQVTLLRELEKAAPDLERFLKELGPFADSSRVSIRALGETAVTGRSVMEKSSDEIAQLRRLSLNAPRLGRPLRQFLQTIDDRGRSVEEEPLARTTAPPAPDKTAYRDGQGFTGMESLLNYVYYQTLAVNAFDDVGHILRIVLLTNNCSQYFTNPTPAQRDDCGSKIGPSAPGLYGQPDPTTDGTAARERGQSGRAVGRRGAGDPEAPAIPGQRDLSQPQITLPPGAQSLLDSLEDTPGNGRSGQGQPPLDALDFLLAP